MRFLKVTINIFFLCMSLKVVAQIPNEYHAETEVIATVTNGNSVPFWMRSNKFGSIPLAGVSSSLVGRFNKEYLPKSSSLYAQRVFDWGFGIDARANIGKQVDARIIELYLKAKVGIFQFKAGRSRDVMGLNGDTTLSSGNFAVSGNALGIPKLEISIPEFYRIPVLDGIISLKGNLAHGMLGKVDILNKVAIGGEEYSVIDNKPKTYIHQKSLYIRFGKKDWKLNLIGGFSHQAFWGNEEAAYGSGYNLSKLQTFYYVAIGKAYGNSFVPKSKIGNQLGSIDMSLTYDFSRTNITFYRQNFYDVGALSKLANIADGLNGISLLNKSTKQDVMFLWKRITVELFCSKNQAGYPWSTFTNSGDEDYYNNYYYTQGWSYNGLGIGSPLVTQRDDARTGQASDLSDAFINNRVIAYHLGLIGQIKTLETITKLTYSKNYGTFATSIYGRSTGNRRKYPSPDNVFKSVDQMSLQIGVLKHLAKGVCLGIDIFLDQGKLLNNSLGGALTAKKAFF